VTGTDGVEGGSCRVWHTGGDVYYRHVCDSCGSDDPDFIEQDEHGFWWHRDTCWPRPDWQPVPGQRHSCDITPPSEGDPMTTHELPHCVVIDDPSMQPDVAAPVPNIDAVLALDLAPSVDPANVLTAWQAARDALNQGRTITYGEVSKALGMGHPWRNRPFYSVLWSLLEVDAEAAANVVNKADGRPSPEFLAYCAEHGIDLPAREYAPVRGSAVRRPVERPLPAPCRHFIVGPCDDCNDPDLAEGDAR
jgi:hypothetical protein